MVLETSRLKLILIREIDWQILAEILWNPFVRKYLCDDQMMAENDINEMILTSQLSFQEKKYGLWFIVEKTSREVSGIVGLWHFFTEEQPQLAYALLPQYTGKGLATEASQRIVDYSFNDLEFNYLTASCDRDNLMSQKVLERLQFQKFKEEVKAGMPLIFYKLERENGTTRT
jgi:[ribosomal protein S5]-alanine N-acetyltransferase